MDIKKRNISFNYIVFDKVDIPVAIADEIKKVLSYVMVLDKADRKLDLSQTKFCILDSAELTDNETYHKLVFKSATHSYRAPLLDRQTVDERENPKTLQEGETLKTHFIIKYQDGDAILLAEKVHTGVAVLQLIMYLNMYKQEYEEEFEETLSYKFAYEVVIKDNLDEELERLSRVQSTSVFVDKQLLGSDALNFTERLDTVQESIVIEVKARRNKSIKDTTKDLLAKLNGGNRQVSKMRIKGKNEANNDVVIDTSFIEKKEYVEARLDSDTGEVNSIDLLNQIFEIAKSL